MPRQFRTLAAALAGSAALALALSGCGGGSDDNSGDKSGGDAKKLTVFAAASLKDPFTEIGKKFESEHEGARVSFNFDGSSNLVEQIQQGAPADVFASADEKNMKKATDGDLMEGNPTPFATNTLTIVTAPGNPKHIKGLKDLSKNGVQTVVCAQEVPCGNATHQVEDKAKVKIKPVSEESKVTDVLGKVEAGQADAGLVYVSDAKGAGDKVQAVSFPESKDVINKYPIGAVKASKNQDLAEQFDDAVTSEDGQKELQKAGFGKP